MTGPGGTDVLASFDCGVDGKDAEKDTRGGKVVEIGGREGYGNGRMVGGSTIGRRGEGRFARIVHCGIGAVQTPWEGFFVWIKDVD